MIKLILLGAIVWIIIRMLKQYASNVEPHHQQPQTQDTVRCHQCNMHIPKQESIVKDGQYYCSKAHLPDDE